MKYLPMIVAALICFTATAQSSDFQEKNPAEPSAIEQKIKVFPNPASNVVTILGLQNSDRVHIAITDISGNVVLQHNWAIRNNSVSIPVPNLKAGIYVVRIGSKDRQIQTKFYKS